MPLNNSVKANSIGFIFAHSVLAQSTMALRICLFTVRERLNDRAPNLKQKSGCKSALMS